MRALITAWALTLILLASALGWSAHVWAQGTISLGTPVLTKVLTFEYPRDCGSFGATVVDGKTVPNPSTCANLDTSAEVNALIAALNTANLSTRSLWRRVLDRIVADFPSRFPGGGTVQ